MRRVNRSLLYQLLQLSNNRCDYCRMPTVNDPLPFQVDHIIAQQEKKSLLLAATES